MASSSNQITSPRPHNRSQETAHSQQHAKSAGAKLQQIVCGVRSLKSSEVSYRCILRVDREWIGNLSDNAVDGVEVAFSVDCQMAWTGETEEQVWPAKMFLDIRHNSGLSWNVTVPAERVSGLPKDIAVWSYPREWPEHPSATYGITALDALNSYFESPQGKEEELFVLHEKSRGLLSYNFLWLDAGALAKSNTFLGECEGMALKVQTFLKELFSKPATDRVKIEFILRKPRVGEKRQPSHGPLDQAFSKFQAAVDCERRTKTWFHEIWMNEDGLKNWKTARKDCWLPIASLPLCSPDFPLVYDNVKELIRDRHLDQYWQMGVIKLLHESLQEQVFDLYPLRVHGSNADDHLAFGALLALSDISEFSTILTPGTHGEIRWISLPEQPIWYFTVSPSQGIGQAADVFLAIWPEREEGLDPTHLQLPQMINVEETIADGSFDKLRQTGVARQKVRLAVKASTRTTDQQWKPLPWLWGWKTLVGADELSRIMTGQNLVRYGADEIGKISPFKPDFVTEVKSRMEQMNSMFATAINVSGARISDEQLGFIFADALEDKIMLANGAAGTSKSTCCALWIAMQFENDPSTRAVVFAKMHKTIDACLESMLGIVAAFTGKQTVREYNDTFDMKMLEWMVDGCPDQYKSLWSRQVRESDRAEVMEVAKAMWDSVKKTSGNDQKHFALHTRTTIWQMAHEKEVAWAFDVAPNAWSSQQPEDYREPQGDSKKRKANTEAEPADSTSNPKGKIELTEDERAELVKEADEMIAHQASKSRQPIMPTGNEHSFLTLVVLLRRKLKHGKLSKGEENEAKSLLKATKETWQQANVAVVCTTISNADSREIKIWKPTHGIVDNAQFVDVHDALVVLRALVNKFVYFVGDANQLSPWVGVKTYNPGWTVRDVSWFENELKRGRPHVELRESRRTDQRGLEMASLLCYKGNLKSALPGVHRLHDKMMQFYRHFLNAVPSKGRELFINVGTGVEERSGASKSTFNRGTADRVIEMTVKLIKEYLFAARSILIIAPYALEGRYIERGLLKKLPDHERPVVGTTPAVMGGEAEIVILSIPKTNSLSFLNTKGYWCVELTRNKLATIVVANDTALQETQSSIHDTRKLAQFDVYNSMVKWCREHNAYVMWPESSARNIAAVAK